MTKIKRIHVKNIKSVSEKELNLNGCSAIITAGNNKGKTTILNSLVDRLNGETPERVIRQGESDGFYEMELTSGEVIKWNAKTNKITAKATSGLQVDSIRGIAGYYFGEKFNIDKFLLSGPKAQVEQLQNIVGLDFTELDAKYKEAYEDRTFYSRKIKQKVEEPNIDFSLEKISIEAYSDDLTKVRKCNSEIDSIESRIMSLKNEREELFRRMDKVANDIALCADKLKSDDLNKGTKYTDSQIQKIENTIRTASEHNSKVDMALVEQQKYKEYIDDVNKHKELDDKVKSIISEKKKIIENSKMPDGITINDGKIYVDGFELDKSQISLSKLYIAALKIASMSLKEVKSLYFDASPLDKVSLDEINKWASKHDYQLLIEKPDFEGGDIEYQIIEEI